MEVLFIFGLNFITFKNLCMKNILVPVGSSETAVHTLRYAVDFAKEFDSRIYLVHVYSSPKISGALINVDAIMERDSREILKGHLEKIDDKGVEIVTSTLKGHSVSDTLIQLTTLLDIDLIISSSKNNGTDEAVFIGKTTGVMIKDTITPVLVIPEGVQFKPVKKIMMAIKSGGIKSVDTLSVLKDIKGKFDATINLLQVKTPKLEDKDLELNEQLGDMVNERIQTRNATIFQGVLEFLRVQDPDMLCVIRRKRGFFRKLWEEDRVKKIDFESTIPLLVLKGMS